ncbi:hypothetical protein DFH27DRAFT_613390 [Peziza echinospora]|nr:hypothetical protein DFH27DRAFT_613390 [Peziza echinospora]
MAVTYSTSMDDYQILVKYLQRHRHDHNINIRTAETRDSSHILITVDGRDSGTFETIAQDAGISITEVCWFIMALDLD